MKKIKVGKTYKARGGWDALVIWIPAQTSNYASIDTGCYAIHKPRTKDESCPIWHQGNGKVSDCTFGVNIAPHYRGHPADIILEEKKAGVILDDNREIVISEDLINEAPTEEKT